MSKPLDGIRVLDLSRVLAGPYSTQMLSDLGADVIKVERPGLGDETRGYGPPFLADRDGNPTAESAYYLSANRGKRSITVELATPEGQEIIRRLAKTSDVLVENFKVGGLAKYALDYPSLSKLNPRLVYCSITGFGQTGPYSHRAGYDFLLQGMSGLMSLTGVPDGEPMKCGLAVSDLSTGIYAANAILAALLERARSGQGQHIDVNLIETQTALLSYHAMSYLVSGKPPARVGNAHPNIVPYQAFATADGHMIVTVGNDEQFRRFVAVLGLPALADDSRFATNADRSRNRAALLPMLTEPIARRATGDWLAELEAVGVPAGPINTLAEALADEHLAARNFVRDMPHPLSGTAPTLSNPARFSRSEIAYEKPAPLLGEHSREILGELGYSEAEIDELSERKAI
jgi:crotonobetainyl-CoA:carnitine CoA-transferase CaiB-like acyl-CoA transferase